MKTITKLLLAITLGLSFFSITNAGLDIFSGDDEGKTIYCEGNSCSLDKGVEMVKTAAKDSGLETEQSATEYIQDLIVKLLTYVSLIAIAIIVFAGFKILTAGGDDEVIKKQKKVITAIAIGILVMWLAATIVNFIMDFISTK